LSVLIIPHRCTRAPLDEFREFVLAYLELTVACWGAQDRRIKPGDRPVPLARLRHWGVGDDVLLWMQYQGHVEQVERRRGRGRARPKWTLRGTTRIDEKSWFALTPLGEAFADLFLAWVVAPADDAEFERARAMMRVGRLAPHYDRLGRVFVWGRHVVKQFRQPSLNQELILSAAEELRWPTWFDDPLPKRSGRDPKARLHDTIKDLNRRQQGRLIHFKGDGSGERLGWELC
jgi:hypothetical protein